MFLCIIQLSGVMDLKYEIGTRIRKYREERNLSQKQFAQLMSISNSRVSNWEQGINRPDADTLADICRVLDVSPSALLDVHLSDEELSDQERKVLRAYRQKPELQQAVNILLGVEEA